MTGELVFAFAVGSVATVNPCGFALLPAYLARRLATEEGTRDTGEAIGRALIAGIAMTFGFLVVFGLGGGAIALGAGWIASAFPWAGLAIGVVLAGLGLAMLSGRRVGLGLILRPAAMPGGLRGDFLFGLGYGTASISCTLPIFLAVAGSAATGGVLAGALSVVAYTLGMGTIVVALAVAAALSKTGLAAAFKGLAPWLPKASGALLFLSGLYVAWFWGFTLFSDAMPGDGNALVVGERLAGGIRTWLGGARGQFASHIVLALLLLLSFGVLFRRLAFRPRSRILGR